VLAFLEQTFRALVKTPILRGLEDETILEIDDLLALPTPEAVRDICEMSRAFRNSQQELLQRTPIVLNPTFAGSADVGGADGDLIAGHSLIEFKASKTELITSRDIFQLLGYACLDYANAYGIQRFGIYLAWRATLCEWSASDLVSELSGGSCDFGRFRQEVTEFIRSDGHRAQSSS
jgi:hypothetical protein